MCVCVCVYTSKPLCSYGKLGFRVSVCCYLCDRLVSQSPIWCKADYLSLSYGVSSWSQKHMYTTHTNKSTHSRSLRAKGRSGRQSSDRGNDSVRGQHGPTAMESLSFYTDMNECFMPGGYCLCFNTVFLLEPEHRHDQTSLNWPSYSHIHTN